ncbi:MAG TPA: UrcA family protein [Steroidobacteraceae bacterium]
MNASNPSTVCAAAFVLCGAFVVSMLPATSHAATDEFLTQKVSYADLDISKPAGAKVLYNRIVKAAYAVCPNYGSLIENFQCINKAIAGAVKQVDSPALSALRSPSVLRLASK